MSILIDNDGVMANSAEPLVNHYRNLGYNVFREDMTSWDFGALREKTGQSVDQILQVFFKVWEEQSEDIDVMDSATVDVFNWILHTYDAAIVTANHLTHVRPWLEMQGISAKYLQENWKKSELNHKIFIEDNPTLVVPAHAKLFIRDNPWNKGAPADERFYHSSELTTLIPQYEHFTTRR